MMMGERDDWLKMADAIEAAIKAGDEVYLWGENRDRVVAALRLAASQPQPSKKAG